MNTRQQLMAASCALLGAGATQAQSTAAPPSMLDRALDGVSFDSALAYYREDGRVQAIEPVVNISKLFSNEQRVDLDVTFDSLSGASPNGAAPSTLAQTFASPSGKSLTQGRHLYVVAPGQLPADPNYQDNRISVSGDWQDPISRVTHLTVGGRVSGEDDFVSVSANASIAHDFNDKNTTLSFGISDEFDLLRPIGGAPVPGSDYAAFQKNGSATKNGVGALAGLTQVMTRNWLSELNISVDRFHGYLNDPYKITSVLDASGNTLGYVYESRPQSRTRKSLYLENRLASDTLSAALALRYMTDDWGIRSDTAQVHVRIPFGNRLYYVEPDVRWYKQSAADFYTPWLDSAELAPSRFEASDTRLGAFRAMTYGIKYAQRLSDRSGIGGSEFSVRLEYYQQTLQHQLPAPLLLRNLDLYPDLKAVLVQLSWRF